MDGKKLSLAEIEAEIERADWMSEAADQASRISVEVMRLLDKVPGARTPEDRAAILSRLDAALAALNTD